MRAATEGRFELAEGLLWDADRQRILWVDILGREVLEGELDDGTITEITRHSFDRMVSAIQLTEDGDLLVAAQDELLLLQRDGGRTPIIRVLKHNEARRTNDTGIDPDGRVLVGTLSMAGSSDTEVLLRLECDGSFTELDGDLTLSNGLAWSTDGTRMFSVDTLRRIIYVRDYPSGPRRVHVHVDEGFPDGIAMDEEDHLWVALWGAGAVVRYAPDGREVERLTVPAPHVSNIAFVGLDLRTLAISTATAELDAEQLRAHPDSGRLFTTSTDVAGIPMPSWKRI